MDGCNLLEMARAIGVQPKRVLSWEEAGYFKPLYRLKGSRHVRYFSPELSTLLTRAAGLIQAGYRVEIAFEIAANELTAAATTPPNITAKETL